MSMYSKDTPHTVIDVDLKNGALLHRFVNGVG